MLVRGNRSPSSVLTSDLDRCSGWRAASRATRPRARRRPAARAGRAGAWRATKPVQVVFGPGTFLNEAVGQIQDQFNSQKAASTQQAQQADEAARKLALARGKSPAEAKKLGKQAQQLVLRGVPEDRLLAGAEVRLHVGAEPQRPAVRVADRLRRHQGAGHPQDALRLHLPEQDSSLDPGPDEAGPVRARARAARSPTSATSCAMPQWRLTNGKGDYVVTGAPVVVDDLSGAISRSLVLLFVVALLVMALDAGARVPGAHAPAAARRRPGGRGADLRHLSLLGASLTMASIGCCRCSSASAVDYAIQLQTRIQEEQRAGDGLRGGRARGPRAPARRRWPPRRPPAPRASLCSCCRPCRWCAASGCCSSAASRSRWATALTLGVAALALGDRHAPRRRRCARALTPAFARGRGDRWAATARSRGARAGASRRAAAPSRSRQRRPGRVLVVGDGHRGRRLGRWTRRPASSPT